LPAAARCFVFGALLALLPSPDAMSQSGGEKFWSQVRDAVSKDDFNAVKNLVKANQADAVSAFFRALDTYVQSTIQGADGIEGERAMMVQLGNAYFVVYDDRDFEKYAQYMQGLSTPFKSVWSNAWGGYLKTIEARDKTAASKDPADLKAVEEHGETAAAAFQELGDRYGIALTRQAMGYAAHVVGEFDKADAHYRDAVAYAQAFGSASIEKVVKDNISAIDVERANKKAAAEKAAAKTAEKSGEKGATPDGADADSTWTKVPLSYKADQGGDAFKTPSPMNTEEYLLWSRMALKDKDLKNIDDIFLGQTETFQNYAAAATGIDPRKSSPLRKFQLMNEKGKLFLDLNDDGTPDSDERVKASSKPDFQEFNLTLEGGKQVKYGMQIGAPGQETLFNVKVTMSQDPDKVLVYRRSCAMQGEALGAKISIVDDNNNGTYEDYGSDGMIIGGQADFLSKIVTHEGKLYEFKFTDPLGHEFRYKPYEGNTGKIVTQWKGKTAPSFLYVRGIADATQNAVLRLDTKAPITVPAGEYEFYFGLLKDGNGRQAKSCEIRKGKSKTFKVEPDGEVTLTLGAPFEFDYKLTSQGEKMQLRGRDLTVLGKLGEQYVRFYPALVTAEVVVKKDSGGQVAKEKLKPIEGGNTWTEDLAWYPKDLEWDKAGKAAFKLKVTGEHPLLGTIKKDDK
jgi:hypothetical protein